MRKFQFLGESLRAQAKSIVIEFIESHPACRADGSGLKQSEIFRACGFDWGERERATSSNQQYWVVALFRELAEEKVIEQMKESGPWRLCS